MATETEGVSAMSAELGGPHCASEWGGRRTGPYLYTSNQVQALLISERELLIERLSHGGSDARRELVDAWNDLPDSLRCHPGLKRLFRAAQMA
jgi:hypothetical protein